MPRKLNLQPLPESERREDIGKFLTVLDRDANLAHVRSILRTGPERQLALFAALERYVVKGSSAASPPGPDDQADLLLCDILDAIDRNPDLKNHGSAYGADRHLANLQVFGLWRKREPISRPTALELFATTISQLIAGAATSSTVSTTINSPAPQDSSQNGDLIGPSTTAQAPCSEPGQLPQNVDGVLVVSTP